MYQKLLKLVDKCIAIIIRFFAPPCRSENEKQLPLHNTHAHCREFVIYKMPRFKNIGDILLTISTLLVFHTKFGDVFFEIDC